MHNLIDTIVHTKARSFIRPREFFISWHGVPTLAYHGFPPAILAIKEEINQLNAEQGLGLNKENPGSKWPKTTLGAIQDDKSLSYTDLCTLRAICTEMNTLIDPQVYLEIEVLQAVIYQCRSQERRLASYKIPLDPMLIDSSAPSLAHLKEVESILSDFEETKLKDYWQFVNKEGNRESHYRAPYIGATLIVELPEQKFNYIDTFIEKVDAHLPNIYTWFSAESRHITVRGLS